MFEVFDKLLLKIVETLDTIQKSNYISMINMKQFVICYKKLDLAESILYSSFRAKTNSMFF